MLTCSSFPPKAYTFLHDFFLSPFSRIFPFLSVSPDGRVNEKFSSYNTYNCYFYRITSRHSRTRIFLRCYAHTLLSLSPSKIACICTQPFVLCHLKTTATALGMLAEIRKIRQEPTALKTIVLIYFLSSER